MARRINIPYLFDPQDRRGAYLDLRANKFQYTNKSSPVDTYSPISPSLANNVSLALIEDMGPNAKEKKHPIGSAGYSNSMIVTDGVVIKQETLAKQPTYRNGMLYFDGASLEFWDLTVKRSLGGIELVDTSGSYSAKLNFQMGLFHGAQYDYSNNNISQVRGTMLIPASRGEGPFEFFGASPVTASTVTNLLLTEKEISGYGTVETSGHILGDAINMITNFGGAGAGVVYDPWSDAGFSNVVSVASWFKDNEALTRLDMSNWDISSILDYSFFLDGASNLRDIDSAREVFSNNIAQNYANAFTGTNLSRFTLDDIFIGLDESGVLNGTIDQSGGFETPTANGIIAIQNLIAKGWNVTYGALDPNYFYLETENGDYFETEDGDLLLGELA